MCFVSSRDDLSLIIKLFYFCTQLLQSVEWKNKSVNCTIGSFSDIIHAVVLSDIFPLVSLFFTHLSATISFNCLFKVIVTEALRVGPVFFLDRLKSEVKPKQCILGLLSFDAL